MREIEDKIFDYIESHRMSQVSARDMARHITRLAFKRAAEIARHLIFSDEIVEALLSEIDQPEKERAR
jgi:hypothetical protein